MGQMRSVDDSDIFFLRALNSVRGHWLTTLLPFFKYFYELSPPLSRRRRSDLYEPSKQLRLPI